MDRESRCSRVIQRERNPVGRPFRDQRRFQAGVGIQGSCAPKRVGRFKHRATEQRPNVAAGPFQLWKAEFGCALRARKWPTSHSRTTASRRWGPMLGLSEELSCFQGIGIADEIPAGTPSRTLSISAVAFVRPACRLEYAFLPWTIALLVSQSPTAPPLSPETRSLSTSLKRSWLLSRTFHRLRLA